ncbi:MAG TPA: ABC transporter substrate-binding protein [Acidimicrobiales bacterium]|nr:ABC transporter substrate-binding protein [Acidimicrobiales bacterium]
MRRTGRRGKVLIVAAVVTGALAWVTASTGPSGAAKATKSTYVIGEVSTDTGGTTGNTNDYRITTAAWQRYVNAHGGINGHPVKVVEKDDGNDPAKSLSAVESLVQSSHALAIIDSSTQDTAWESYVSQNHVLVICGSATGNGFPCASQPDYVPAGTTVLSVVWAQTFIPTLLHKTRWGVVYCSELAACAQAVPLNRTYAAQVGVKVVYAQAASSSAPDYTAQCLGAKDAGVQVLFGYAGSTKIAEDCARQGYRPIWEQSSGTFTAAYRTNPYENGSIGNIGIFPWFLDVNKATHQFRQALAKYWPNFDQFTQPYNADSTWAALQLFKAAAATLPPNPTMSDVWKGVYALPKNFTLGGLIPPETVTPGKATTNPCFYIVRIEHERYTAPYKLRTFCQHPLPGS